MLEPDESFFEDELQRRVDEIETSILCAPNAVRSDMNRAVITIGGRSQVLRKALLAAAKHIGDVTVQDARHAETVEKMWARSGARFGSSAAHECSMKSMRRRC